MGKKEKKRTEFQGFKPSSFPGSNIELGNIKTHRVSKEGKIEEVSALDILNNIERRLKELEDFAGSMKVFRMEIAHALGLLRNNVLVLKDNIRALTMAMPMLFPMRSDTFKRIYAFCGHKLALLDPSGNVKGDVQISRYSVQYPKDASN